MKLRKVFAVLGVCALGLLASCSKEEKQIESFTKDFAISSLNDKDLIYSTDIVRSRDFVGDYYMSGTGFYKSVHTGKSISATQLRQDYVNDLKIYVDDRNNCYDAFGDRIDFRKENSYRYDQKYMIVAQNSPFYKMLDGVDANYDNSLDLKILKLNILNESKVIVSELNDSHFKAKNVLDYNYFYSADLIDNLSSIEVLNNTEIRVKEQDRTYRIKADIYNNNNNNNSYEDNFRTNTIRIHEDDLVHDDNYLDYVNINFSGMTTPFVYGVKKVDGISNDFDFVLDGLKYKIKSNGKHSEPFFILPGYVLKSKDNSYAVVLGKKILDDGNLSNKNYTYVIKNDLSVSKGVLDTSVFELNVNYIFNGKVETLKPEETLLVLKDNYKVILDENGVTIYNANNPNTTRVTSINHNELISPNSIGGYYYLYDYPNKVVKYFSLDGDVNTFFIKDDFKILNREYLLFANGDSNTNQVSIKVGNEEVCLVSNNYQYNVLETTSFGQKTSVVAIKDNSGYESTTYIINFK